jgi:hypothetical protein
MAEGVNIKAQCRRIYAMLHDPSFEHFLIQQMTIQPRRQTHRIVTSLSSGTDLLPPNKSLRP